MARETTRTVGVRPPSLGALLDLCAVFGSLSGDPRPEPGAITEDNASAVLSALRVDLYSFASGGALVETARACYVAFMDAVNREEAAASGTVAAVEDACVAWLPSGGETSGLERLLGSLPPSDALALWDAPLSVALRLLGWGAVASELARSLEAARN